MLTDLLSIISQSFQRLQYIEGNINQSLRESILRKIHVFMYHIVIRK
jgi:hypothetical protein